MQSVLLSLGLQSVWCLVADPSKEKQDNPTLGSVYRSASLKANNEKSASLNYPQATRDTRSMNREGYGRTFWNTGGYSGGGGNYDDR